MAIPNRGPQITGTTILFLALSWIVVTARFYARIFLTKNFFLDDILTGICLVLFTAYGAVGIVGVYWGAGRHVYDLPPGHIRSAMKVWYFCELTYAVTACVLRVTVGIFLLRIVTEKIHRWTIHFLNVVGVTFSICYLAEMVFQCIPLSFYWERLGGATEGICFDPNISIKTTIAATVIAGVTDWVFGLMPIWVLWNVRLSRQKKIVICTLLGLGILASTAPIIRLPYLTGLLNNLDFLWATTDVAIWSVVELGIGLIVISLPACRPIFRNYHFFAAMSTSNTATPPSFQIGGSNKLYRKQKPPAMGYQDNNSLPPISNNPKYKGNTFLSDSSTMRDVESSMDRSVSGWKSPEDNMF